MTSLHPSIEGRRRAEATADFTCIAYDLERETDMTNKTPSFHHTSVPCGLQRQPQYSV